METQCVDVHATSTRHASPAPPVALPWAAGDRFGHLVVVCGEATACRGFFFPVWNGVGRSVVKKPTTVSVPAHLGSDVPVENARLFSICLNVLYIFVFEK